MNFQAKIKFVIVSVKVILPNVGVTDLPGHDRKVTSDKKIICNSYQRYKGRNTVCCSPFSVIFETTTKFLIFFVRLILGKVLLTDLKDPYGKLP